MFSQGQELTCLQCARYAKCKDENKGAFHFCSKFEKMASRGNIIEIFSDVRQATTVDAPSTINRDYEKAEFDLVKLIDSTVDSNSNVMRDLKVDDRDLKEFPNFFEFSMSRDGLNVTPYARQMASAMHLFAEFCPDCSDPKFIRHIKDFPVDFKTKEFPSKIQFLEYGVCPKCKGTKRHFVKKKKLNFYEELAGLAGQRGGKSAFTSMISAYVVHRYVKMQRPTEALGLLPNTTLTGTFVALTYAGAVELLWTPVRDAINDSPWFQEYHKMLNYYGEKYGEELYKNMDTFLHYKHRKLLIYASGPNKRTLRGRTRFLSGIDEIGWFDNSQGSDAKEKQSADEVYTALDRSLLSVRTAARRLLREGYNNTPNGYAFNISSPSNARDKIVTLVNNNQHSRQIFAFHLSTWELNPKITRKDLQKEFDADPVKAERDYGAQPPLADSPFIEDPEIVQKMEDSFKNRVQYKYLHKQNKQGRNMRAAQVVKVRKANTVYPAILTMDAGFSNNSFAITVSHRIKTEKRFLIETDVMVEVAPEKGKCTLNYAKITNEIIYPLIKEFNVKAVVADRWNSLKLLHDIEEDFPGVFTEQYSLRYDDFFLVKSYMEGGLIKIPRLEMKPEEITKVDMNDYPHVFKYMPVSHFFLQCLTVTDTGRTVDKGMNMTDDLWRSFVLGMKYLLDDDFVKEYLKDEGIKTIRGVGAVLGKAMGGSSATGAVNQGALKSQTGQGLAVISGGGAGSYQQMGHVFSRR